jgi:glutaredoxin
MDEGDILLNDCEKAKRTLDRFDYAIILTASANDKDSYELEAKAWSKLGVAVHDLCPLVNAKDSKPQSASCLQQIHSQDHDALAKYIDEKTKDRPVIFYGQLPVVANLKDILQCPTLHLSKNSEIDHEALRNLGQVQTDGRFNCVLIHKEEHMRALDFRGGSGRGLCLLLAQGFTSHRNLN